MKKLIFVFITVFFLLFVFASCDETNKKHDTDKIINSEVITEEITVASVPVTYTFLGESFDPTVYDGISGDKIILPKSDYFEFGTVFKGWNDGEKTYSVGEEYILPDKNVIFTAVREEGGTKLMLDSCEDNSAWWGIIDANRSIIRDNREYVEGNASLSTYSFKTEGADKDCSVMCVLWKEPYDLSAFTNGYLHFSIYFNDPEKICFDLGGAVVMELSSYNEETFESKVSVYCDLAGFEAVEGWNEFIIPLQSGIDTAKSHSDYSTDLASVKSMRFFAYSNGETTFNIDDVYVWTEDIPVDVYFESGLNGDDSYKNFAFAGEMLTLPNQTVYPMNMQFVGWKYDGSIYKAGEAISVPYDKDITLTSVWSEDEKFTVSFNLNSTNLDNPLPITDYYNSYFYLPEIIYQKDGYVFSVWSDGDNIYPAGSIYTIKKDVELFAVWEETVRKDGLIECFKLNLGGTDSRYIQNSVSGRNEAVSKYVSWLPNDTFGFVSDFSCDGSYVYIPESKLDLAKDFTISAYFKAPKRSDVSQRTLLTVGDAVNTKDYKDELVLFEIEKYRDLEIGSPDRKNKKSSGNPAHGEGACIFDAEISGEFGTVSLMKKIDPIDISAYYENGFLHAWVYVEDTAGILSTQIELSSSGMGDNHEINWDIDTSLKNGWNELFLDIKNASEYCGGADLTKINFFRIYFNFDAKKTSKYKVGIDTFSFMNRPLPEEPDFKLSLDKNGYITAEGIALENAANGAIDVCDGKWHNIIIARSNNILNVFVDNEKHISTEINYRSQISHSIFIGSDINGESVLMGSVSLVEIYDKSAGIEISKIDIDSQDNESKETVMRFHKSVETPTRLSTRTWTYGQAEIFTGFENYKGFAIQDLKNIKKIGFDSIKFAFNPENLMHEDGSLNIGNMRYIENDVNKVLDCDLNVILCVHPQAEFKVKYLGDLDNFELLTKWYNELAAYIQTRWDEERVALMLMSEPHANSSSVSWSYMTDRMIMAVRNQYPEITIIACSDKSGNIEQLKLMTPVTDDNVVYTFTTYEPYIVGWSNSYSGSTGSISLYSYLKDIPYPIEAGVDYTQAIEEAISMEPNEYKEEARKLLWDYVNGKAGTAVNIDYGYPFSYNWHLARAKSLNEWSEANGGNVHIYVSEFGVWDRYRGEFYGAPKGTGLENSTRLALIKDFVNSFEAYGITWNYWGYCDSFTVFDPYANTYILPDYDISYQQMVEYIDRELMSILGFEIDF